MGGERSGSILEGIFYFSETCGARVTRRMRARAWPKARAGRKASSQESRLPALADFGERSLACK